MTAETRSACVDMCKMFHMSTGGLSLRYRTELGRFNYVTPTSYLEMLLTFKSILDKKRTYVPHHPTDYSLLVGPLIEPLIDSLVDCFVSIPSQRCI